MKMRLTYDMLEKILLRYCLCKLTYNDDKLPVLSGIVSVYGEITGDRYVAGLWERFLPFGLVWFCEPRTSKSLSRAPSWPWACADDVVRFAVGLAKLPNKGRDAGTIVPALGGLFLNVEPQ